MHQTDRDRKTETETSRDKVAETKTYIEVVKRVHYTYTCSTAAYVALCIMVRETRGEENR